MLALAAALAAPALCFAQASNYGVGTGRPSVEAGRNEMGIPSTDDVRGQLDTTGYASTAEAMAKVWDLAAQGPQPAPLAPPPAPGILGAIGPHDDYVYAARVDRQLYPLITAKIVLVVGVLHRYKRLAAHDQMIFDRYRAWRTPDGALAISALRDELIANLPRSEVARDNLAHDLEHSVEPIAYFLKHARRDVELVPVLIPAASPAKLAAMADHLAAALASTMKRKHLALGRDVAIVISSDGTHYGDDFTYAPFGAGGVDAFQKAAAQERALVADALEGPVSADKTQRFINAVVDPRNPDAYRMSWCGRFSVPFGLRLIGETAKRLGLATPRGIALAIGASVDTPALKVPGTGATAPANLYHFVFHPAVAFVAP